MATKQILVDDLTGDEGLEEGAVATHRFMLDGQDYEIDLTQENYAMFLRSLEPYTKRGRARGKAVITTGRPARTKQARNETAEIRAWAKTQGIQIADRGRIPASVVSSYRAGHV